MLATFKTHGALHLLNLEYWFAGHKGQLRFRGFNHHRETIAENFPEVMMVWLTRDGIRDLALEAPDLWAWRSAVLDFTVQKEPEADRIVEREIDLNIADYSSRLKRIQEIDDYLADKKEDLSERQLGLLLLEKGRLLSAVYHKKQPIRGVA